MLFRLNPLSTVFALLLANSVAFAAPPIHHLVPLEAVQRTTSSRGEIEHAVFVWLKRPGNAKDRSALIRATKELQKTTGLIRSVRYGRPVPSNRPAVDDTFDLALFMRFANRRALTEFENHPAHEQAKKQILQPLARKVLIYDTALE
jgi:hypothetical protein